MSIEFVPFRPALKGLFAERFYNRIERLVEKDAIFSEVNQVVQKEVQWAVKQAKINPKQRQIYRASWLLFRDLLRVGWNYRWHAGTLEISPPQLKDSAATDDEIKQAKNKVKQAMATPRLERINESRDFIERMESPPEAGIASLPVTALIADGKELAKSLSHIASIADQNEKLQKLKAEIQPYLQLVREGERCIHSGHKLGDIWRYFRLTWATPAENTPGRTMLYLIRDAARPYHPIMGIASLENAPLRIACRDDFLGWSLDSFHQEVSRTPNPDNVRESFKRLLKFIHFAIDEIDLTDLCSEQECQNPSESLFLRLANIVTRSSAEREQALIDWRARLQIDADNDDEDDLTQDRSELGNISKTAETALYRRKRAERLAQLLHARKELNDLLNQPDFTSTWQRFLATENGQTAVRRALIAHKNRHIGTSMLELNVCGAIPPYNEILGGKLVALLMLSPQVVFDYRERYGERPSDIASRMKGEPVIRPAELAFIGTTSLYRVGSSQYNRLRLPANLLKQDAPEIRWQNIGETSGYGTLHISRDTLQSLEEAASTNGNVYVHHIFGEGASPKLRAVRQALNIVLESGQKFTSAEITKHSMSRIVYGAWLCTNGANYFRGIEDNPRYYFDPNDDPAKGTQKIVEYWRERWLLMRLNHKKALQRIAKFKLNDLLVSKDLANIHATNFTPIVEELLMTTGSDSTSSSLRSLILKLYRGASAQADGMDSQWLEAIHIPTNLDREIKKALEAGKSVVLTGNPGDGKTHLIRRWANVLQNLPIKPIIEMDASAIPNGQLKVKWERAYAEGRPFCMAINEAVLKNMADTYKDFAPIQEAQRQVEEAVIYSSAAESLNSYVVVYDLSRRNILAPDVVKNAIEKLTDPNLLKPCEACPLEAGCDLLQNSSLLRTSRVQERVQAILNRISRRGHHVTLRQLQALISYLVFGGRSCQKILQESGNESTSFPQLPYSGEGKIFDLLSGTFDPAKVAHPIWDDRLVNAETSIDDWLPEWQKRKDSLDPGNLDSFEVRKRAFFFFHKNGNDLLSLDNDDENEFAQLLAMPERESLRLLIRGINHFFGDKDDGNHLRVWQSHRFNQSPRRIIYSSMTYPRGSFEIVHPRLSPSMAKAFDLVEDHVLLRLKDYPQARLRIDFSVFEVIAQCRRGVPVLSIDNDATRRLWQFMEKLARTSHNSSHDETEIIVLNTSTREELSVLVDLIDKQYLAINQRSN
ncbi:Druantia anti-phage system protein DruA [Candidatus Leptofilum sp.]|uniref:Druantia anti-phage system protein DruA n=1 Tax=Candidatus Leptofilum sp. TaxID=3241576 RepID=UPI003B5C063C